MSMCCAVQGCSNSSRVLKKWLQAYCDQHMCKRQANECSCSKPFRLYPFPTSKKNHGKRDSWKKLLNRIDKDSNKLFSPSKDSRICSLHFVDGMPTDCNPYPTLKMGCDTKRRALILSPPSKIRKTNIASNMTSSGSSRIDQFSLKSCYNQENPFNLLNKPIIRIKKPENSFTEGMTPPSTFISTSLGNLYDTIPNSHTSTFSSFPSVSSSDKTNINCFNDNQLIKKENKFLHMLIFSIGLLAIIRELSVLISNLKAQIRILEVEKKNDTRQYQVKPHKTPSKQIIKTIKEKKTYEVIIRNDKLCNFYTNISSIKLFHKLHDFLLPFVKRRFKSTLVSNAKRTLQKHHKQIGRARKLCSKDEFLLVLMKLRLGSLYQDLAVRFNVAVSTCSEIFQSWIRAMAKSLSCVIFTPDQEIMRAITPVRFGKYSDTIGVIDCSEIFIETPRNLELQAATWSDYKHHNTMKFLLSVGPNGFITFISEAYTGRCSDKFITNDSDFLKTVPSHSRIMADKGFSIGNECSSSSIYFTVPPGRRGISQMPPAELIKTTEVAKLRIVVEQVIRRIKTHRILSNEFPITMLPHLNNILIVCAALSNMKVPIMIDY
ncbi:uncharacterized protein LOC136087229 [Hydra vulgaris]|uniref:Uncharacterized protein LOC136087229 n=1 Tax=Hydra vulgaris TaxID=6087 RepID=A0ABM4CUZ5_HYDVU